MKVQRAIIQQLQLQAKDDEHLIVLFSTFSNYSNVTLTNAVLVMCSDS